LVIFGTGISCAIDNRLGMAALTDELVQNVGKVCSSKEQQDEWNAVELVLKLALIISDGQYKQGVMK